MTTALAPRTGLPGTRSEHSYALPADLTFDEWRGIVGTLQIMDRAVKWWLGDALVYGERRFGEEHTHILPTVEEDPHGVSQSAMKQAAWVSSKWPPNTRVPELSWTHHRVVAELEPEDRSALLQEAVTARLSTRDLVQRVKQRQEELRSIPADSTPVCAAEEAWRPSPDDLTEEAAARMRFERTMAGRAATFETGWTAALAWVEALDCFNRD